MTDKIEGSFILPVHCKSDMQSLESSLGIIKSEKKRKYIVASCHNDSSALSHNGSLKEINTPAEVIRSENIRLAIKDCLAIFRALSLSCAPMAWATCTAKPEAQPEAIPPKSQVEEETRPIEAEAAGPKEPTMAASMYSIIISPIWARMPGSESVKTV